MYLRLFSFCFAVMMICSPARAAEPSGDPLEDPEVLDSYPTPDNAYYNYLKSKRLECQGDAAALDKPFEMKLAGRTYIFNGPTLSLAGKDPDGVVAIGVLGAIKDFGEETRPALTFFLDHFEKEKVDALLLLGDIASSEFELTQILIFCARRPWPVLAIIGNTESRASFNRALLAALKAAPNIINMDFVRLVDLGGAVLVGLPGYIDRRFVHETAGCTYTRRDLRKMRGLVEGVKDTLVFVSHGPPRGEGADGLDFAAEGGNVGDKNINAFLKKHKIAFGIFSHIIEAGGRTDDGQGRALAPGKYADSLWINVGSANPLSWQLNSGRVSCGMGAVVRIKEGKASYNLVQYPCK
jgi:Icc-related predicted phosphoesterase